MKTTTSRRLRQLLPCLLYLICALACFLIPVRFSDAFVLGAGFVSLASAIPFAVHAVKWKRNVDGLAAAAAAVFGLVCLACRSQGAFLVSLLYGLYLTAIGVVFAIQAGLENWQGARILDAMLYLAAGIGLLVFIRHDQRLVMDIIGAYLLLQAWQNAQELYCFSRPYDARYWSFRHWAALPAFIVGILPSFVISRIQDRKLRHEPVDFDARKNDKPVNLRIWIHTGTYSFRLYGHMTFSRNSVMYSYGDYDVPQEKLFGTIGPGIFFTANDEVYANNCCIVEQCPLFEYGLHITPAQEKRFDEMSKQIMENTIPWMCPMETALKEGKKAPFSEYEHMYANRVWYRTACAFRKYVSGPWKWYALLGNNCSNFAASKLNEIGLDLPVSHGIVSPGEFYEVLETAFDDPDSCVVTRSYHTAKIPSSLFDVPD